MEHRALSVKLPLSLVKPRLTEASKTSIGEAPGSNMELGSNEPKPTRVSNIETRVEKMRTKHI